MEDAETGAVQRKALKLATAVAQQAKDPPTAAAPSRRCQMAMTVPGRPFGTVDCHRSLRSSDAGPAYGRRYVAVLGAFPWGARRAKQQRGRAGKKTLRRLADWISRGVAMQALTARQSHPITLKYYI
jgi:hypothetical protein